MIRYHSCDDYVTLHGKRDFAAVLRSQISRPSNKEVILGGPALIR